MDKPFYLAQENRMLPDEILDKFSVKDHNNNVFHLGCLSGRATIASQQQRALNLLWAMKEKKWLNGKKLVIVGAGFSGLMFAAGLKILKQRCEFDLFDKYGECLHLQNGNVTRFVQPHIYDWPALTSRYPKTLFPYLNWDSAEAGKVAQQVFRQWKRLDIKVEKRKVVGINSGLKPKVRWIEDAVESESEVDFVILAVGFGLEEDVFTGNSLSYWSNDPLNQSHLGKNVPAKVLVSGGGDGGLTDVLRAKIKNFDHQTFIHDFVSSSDYPEFVASAERVSDPEASYSNVKFPEPLLKKLSKGKRKDTEVTFVANQSWFSSKGSALLNRMLVGMLCENGDVEIRHEKVIPAGIKSNGRSYVVPFLVVDEQTKEGFFCEFATFDHIVLRHGTIKECNQLFSEKIWSETEAEWSSVKKDPTTDRTALSHYDDDFLVDESMPYRGEVAYEVVYPYSNENEAAIKQACLGAKGPSELTVEPIGINHPRYGCSLGIRVTTSSRQKHLSFLQCMASESYFSYGIKVSKDFFEFEKPDAQPLIKYCFLGTGIELVIEETNDGAWLRVMQRHSLYPLKDAHGLLSADDMMDIARTRWSLKRLEFFGWRLIESRDSNLEHLSALEDCKLEAVLR